MFNALFDKDQFVMLDGGMGTMLQAAGLVPGQRPEVYMMENPDTVVQIHKAYIKAGSQVVSTNTFGANPKKLKDTGYTTEQIVSTAVSLAKKAAEGTNAKVALDVGPLGEMLEPAGTLKFEEAVDLFAQTMKAGQQAGADLIVVETMTDLYEIKAALLAARENTNLPVIASMSFETNGRTFSGTPIEAMAATLEPLGASALGINCSLGPALMVPLARRLCAATSLPVYLKPNAGLPDPATGAYTLSPEAFAEEMRPCLELGISMAGGCCGTRPETIQALAKVFGGQKPAQREYQPVSRVCSSSCVVDVEGVCAIGERINPTGKKKMQQALASGDMSYLQSLAVAQQQDGAQILGVNVGAPGVDEVECLPKAIKAVQAVSDLPLQIDSSNPEALQAALRVYNGKPVINSTTGEQEKMEAVLPLCKDYGTALVCLTLDEKGIPDTADGRVAIAERILHKAQSMGIRKENIWIDCLTLTVSADPDAAEVTVQAVEKVSKDLGLKTILGVTNISYGLPNRPLANRTFLTLALGAGLNLPIINPLDTEAMDILAAFKLMKGRDVSAENYIARFQERAVQPAGQGKPGDAEITLGQAVESGLKEPAAKAARQLLQAGSDGMAVVEHYLMPALDKMGKGFEEGTVFLPQLLSASNAAQSAFEVVREAMGESGGEGPAVVLATVHGDIHDIGKNIVKALLENYGYHVVDLGRDVPPEDVVAAVEKTGARLVGLSALMTTTLPAMEETIRALREKGLACQVMVGGAVLTEDYAHTIGADFYAKDAQKGIDIARRVFA